MSPNSIEIGSKIEDYQILDFLGKGAFAKVHRAKCLRSGFEVALKMIDKVKMRNSGMVERVIQEINIHSRLKHPAILELYTSFEDANYVYLVLEIAHNGELYRYLKDSQRVMTEAETANILMQIVNGLLYLKANKIAHRDMSLSNLLLTKDLKVKIADFGLAAQLSRPGEKHTTLCGTPNFISPEVASRATHGLKVDVWGLGCTMYALLVGKPPFDTDGITSTLTRVVMTDYVVPNYLSMEAKDLLDRLLQKNPEVRIDIQDVPTHPFMLKHMAASHPSYRKSVASLDSGLFTMSSGMTSAQNITGKMEHIRSRLDEQGYYQTKVPNKADNMFGNMKMGHSASSLYNRYDSEYNDYAQQPLQSRSNEIVDRNRNIGLMQQQQQHQQQQMDQRMFEGYSSKPGFGRLHSANDVITNGQENQFYGLQLNQVQIQNANFEPVLPKHQPLKAKANPKLCIPPLKSDRLLPRRLKIKTIIFSILPSGEIVVESVKFKKKYNEERVVEVFRISKDGLRIVVYQPDAGRGLKIQDSPPDLPESGVDIYNYENLPAKHQTKYMHANRFLQMVRAKTPKITFYSAKAQCELMENVEHFEIKFYDGEKIIRTSENNVSIFDKTGKSITLIDSVRALWQHYEQCFDHCKALERALNNIHGESKECFPIIIGKRPATAPALNGTNCNGNGNHSLTPRLANASSLMSLNSVTSNRVSHPKSSPHFQAPSEKVIVPKIGIASRLVDGTVEVVYQDGSRLAVRHLDQGGGITFTQNGSQFHYTGRDETPQIVLEKLEQMPFVVQQLAANDCSPMQFSAPINNRCMQPQNAFNVFR